MPSSYSPSLRIELVADNEQSGVWGQTTNRNFSQVIEEALAGTAEVDVTAADVTLTAVNGATDQARRPFIRVIGTPTVARQVNVPDVNKNYLVQNTTGQTITIKPTGQTGSAVLPGQSAFIRTRQGASSQMIEFVATSGGALTVTSTTAAQIGLRSGAAGSMAYYDFGRTAREGALGVSAGVSQLTTGDVAGDATLLATTRLWLSIAGTGQMKIDLATGVTARAGFSAEGNVAPPAASGIRLGTTSNFPTIAWHLSGAPVDNKNWDSYADGDSLYFRTLNDARNVAVNWMQVVRTGTAISHITTSGKFGIGAVPSMRLEVLASPPGSGTDGILVRNSDSSKIAQLLLTGPSFTYAGVGGGQAWLYSNATTDLNVGPDGAGTVALVSGGSRRFTVTNIDTTSYQRLLIANAGNENIRMLNDGAYISFYNSAGATRTGYIQSNASGNTVIARETAGNIEFIAGGATRFLIASDGRLLGYNTHNNPNGMAGAQVIGSATYTPGVYASTALVSISVGAARYTRVGNVVTVSGAFSATTQATSTSIHLTLPIPTSALALSGTGASDQGVSAVASAGPSSTVYLALRSAASAVGVTLHYIYQYEVA